VLFRSKNALLFAPIALAHDLGNSQRLAAVVVAFAAFCAVASLGYLVNDLLDIEADRRHASKRNRPFALGTLGIPQGVALCAGLLCFGAGASALALPWAFTGMLALYLCLTLSYTFYFKEKLFLDTLMLASFYTLRVLAGGVATQIPVSEWLLAFAVFFFLSLALVKRYAELIAAARSAHADGESEKLARRAYQLGDTGLVETMGITSGYVSVLVLGLYVSSESVARFYSSPDLLWLISPLMLFWISRIWFLARRGQLPHDPVLFAATDRTSYLTGALVILVGVLAAVVGK
jgi:4-hydroxybenzoate polyprenyltransferase